MKKLLVLALVATLTGCETTNPGGPSFGEALAVGLVRLASDEPRHLSLEEIVFHDGVAYESQRRGLTP